MIFSKQLSLQVTILNTNDLHTATYYQVFSSSYWKGSLWVTHDYSQPTY